MAWAEAESIRSWNFETFANPVHVCRKDEDVW